MDECSELTKQRNHTTRERNYVVSELCKKKTIGSALEKQLQETEKELQSINDAVIRMANRVMELDETLTNMYLKESDIESAITFMVSRSECLIDLGRVREAYYELKLAKKQSSNAETTQWIDRKIDELVETLLIRPL